MKICFVASECVPYVKTGGLADISGSLPRFLENQGCEVKLFIPGYGSIRPDEYGLAPLQDLKNLKIAVAGRAEKCGVWTGTLPDSGVQVYLVDSTKYFDRGSVYTSDPDEDERFIFFQRAVFSILEHLKWPPDILHANDWQAALLPVYLREHFSEHPTFRNTRSVLSIHNLAYQGTFGLDSVEKAGLDSIRTNPGDPFEYFGGFSFLKAGLCYADAVSTVSPSYAQEIQGAEFGAGLDGVLRARGDHITGILNGVDTDVWNPSIDPYIASPYGAESLELKSVNRKALLDRFGLPDDKQGPVVGIVSRFARQKGFELLFPGLDSMLNREEFQMTVLGSGDPDTEAFFRRMAEKWPGGLGVHVGYDETLAHQIEAGADVFLMPSLYEPCGLNQMYSLIYGTPPVVHQTGGLADTVRDLTQYPSTGTGFVFREPTPESMTSALRRAVDAWSDQKSWSDLQKRGMSEDFSWDAAASSYMRLYRAVRKADPYRWPK